MAKEGKIVWRRSIRIKIIAVSVMIATLVLGVSGIFFYRYIETTKTDELEQLANVTADRLSHHLEFPMWDVDYEQVGKLLEAEMMEPRISGLIVRDEDRKALFAARERTYDGGVVESNGDLLGNFVFARRDVTHSEESIGNVTVFVSPALLEAELLRFAWGVGIVVLVLDALMLIFLGIVLGRTVIMPLETLAAHAERISRGNLNQKIEIDSEDEFGSLATTLNRMQAGLRTAIVRLRNR